MRTLRIADWVVGLLGQKVSSVSKFGAAKSTKAHAHPACHDARSPSVPALECAEQTRGAGRFCGADVLGVFCRSNVSEIGKLVVISHAISVVYKADWPRSVHIQPSKSVCSVGEWGDSDGPVPLIGNSPSYAPFSFVVWPINKPCKNASLRVVVKQFAQTLCGKIGLIHDTVLSLIGQRPARVISTGGLRHFITHACSGAAEITKCLHQAARAAVSVCMPANHRRFSNPLGL